MRIGAVGGAAAVVAVRLLRIYECQAARDVNERAVDGHAGARAHCREPVPLRVETVGVATAIRVACIGIEVCPRDVEFGTSKEAAPHPIVAARDAHEPAPIGSLDG